MTDFDFDQTGESTPRATVAYTDLSAAEQRRVDQLVRRMQNLQRDGRPTTLADLVGFTSHELWRLAPIARQRMQAIVFRQDHLETALSDEIARETVGGDMPDDRAVEIAVATASGLIPSDAHIASELLGKGIPAKTLGRIWPRVKARLGAHTAATTRMPEVA